MVVTEQQNKMSYFGIAKSLTDLEYTNKDGIQPWLCASAQARNLAKEFCSKTSTGSDKVLFLGDLYNFFNRYQKLSAHY